MTITGKIPSLGDALLDPLSYAISYNGGLGWILSEVGGEFSTLITQTDAEVFILATEETLSRIKS